MAGWTADGRLLLRKRWKILELPGMPAGVLELSRTSWKNLERPLYPPTGGGGLAIRLGAMADAEDAQNVILKREQDAVVAEAQAERACHVAVQGSDIATAGAGIVKNAVKDTHGGGTVEAAHVGLGLIEPLNTVGRHYLLSGKSSGFMPNSASTSSMGTPLPLAKKAWPS